MDTNLKLRLLFSDKPGVLANLASLVAREGFNIVAVDVERQEERTTLYLEAEGGRAAPSKEMLIEEIRAIPELLEMSTIQALPHEKREKRMQILLDSVSDGIFFIDEEGTVVLINKVAQQVLNVDAPDVLGKKVTELQLPDYTILECLTDKTFVNVKKDIITDTGRLQFFVTCKPIKNTAGRIIGAVEMLKDMKEIKTLANAVIQPPQITFSDIIGESRAIKEAISFAQKIAPTDSYISIQGESGTGKELFAAAIHLASGRSGLFVPVNCAALPEALLESELFGYVGGAFSGARKEGKPGLFEVAKGGTIFLDEITELPLGLQAKLLRALQEKTVRRIGGTQEIAVSARIITATNKTLEQAVKDRQFREDLYYRINVLPIHIPPLRERIEDIPLLTEHFILQLNTHLEKNIRGISGESLAKLCRHSWPGNVRELRNVIERAVILCSAEQVDAESIIISFDSSKTIEELRSQSNDFLEQCSLHAMLDRYEKQIITAALAGSQSIRKAAQKLDISHTALLKKMKKHQ